MFRIVTCKLVILTSCSTNLELLLLSREAAYVTQFNQFSEWGNVYISVFYVCNFYPLKF